MLQCAMRGDACTCYTVASYHHPEWTEKEPAPAAAVAKCTIALGPILCSTRAHATDAHVSTSSSSSGGHTAAGGTPFRVCTAVL